MGSKNASTKNHKKKEVRPLAPTEKLNKSKKKGKDNSKPDDSPPQSHDDNKVISDPRFSKVHTDPRFREAPKRVTKVAIDSRFNKVFTDKSFLPGSAPVDKRGRPKHNTTSQLDTYRHYYKIDVEDDENKVEHSSHEEEEEDTSESESAIDTGTDVDTDTDTDEGVDEEVYEEEAPDVQVLLCT